MLKPERRLVHEMSETPQGCERLRSDFRTLGDIWESNTNLARIAFGPLYLLEHWNCHGWKSREDSTVRKGSRAKSGTSNSSLGSLITAHGRHIGGSKT